MRNDVCIAAVQERQQRECCCSTVIIATQEDVSLALEIHHRVELPTRLA